MAELSVIVGHAISLLATVALIGNPALYEPVGIAVGREETLARATTTELPTVAWDVAYAVSGAPVPAKVGAVCSIVILNSGIAVVFVTEMIAWGGAVLGAVKVGAIRTSETPFSRS
jgi:hypothetical protein